MATRKDGGDMHGLPLELPGIIDRPNVGGHLDPSTPESERQDGRKADASSSLHETISGQTRISSSETVMGNISNLENTPGGANEPPDVSPEFRSEMAAISAHYRALIAAVRRRLSGHDSAAAIRVLMDEETIALRAVTERWQAAAQKQQDDKPHRPTGKIRRGDDLKRP